MDGMLTRIYLFAVDCIPTFVAKPIEWISIHGPITAFLTQRFELWMAHPARVRRRNTYLAAKLLRGSNSKFRCYYHLHPAVFSLLFRDGGISCEARGTKYELKASKPRLAGEQMNIVDVFFSHHWLIVNTRGFSYLRPSREPSDFRELG
jgi:hypothetical protein